jgi:hypothetical protein
VLVHKKLHRMGLGIALLLGIAPHGWAAPGTEGASFLDIPVGAGPAALASTYTSQAKDAYAPVWNPAGLAYLDSIQAAGMHVSYLQGVHYEYLGLAMPLEDKSQGLGFAVQYLGSGNITGRDENGIQTSDYSSTFAAYSLAYGARLADNLSAGATAKVITEKISDVSGNAYAADGGLLYMPSSRLTLGAAVANLGSNVKLVSQSDPLPLAVRAGATWAVKPEFNFSGEGVYRRDGLLSGSVSGEYKYLNVCALRAGYDTSHTKQLSAAAGIRGGIAVFFKGQELAYAIVPYGDLGTTHFVSLVIRFTTKARADQPKPDTAVFEDSFGAKDARYDMDELLTEEEKRWRQH